MLVFWGSSCCQKWRAWAPEDKTTPLRGESRRRSEGHHGLQTRCAKVRSPLSQAKNPPPSCRLLCLLPSFRYNPVFH